MKKLIYDVKDQELQDLLNAEGYEKYRFKQLEKGLKRAVLDVSDLSDLPTALRQTLADSYDFNPFIQSEYMQSQIDATRKYILRLRDGNIIECVYMEYEFGSSICISSQAGCRMACSFCASTMASWGRQLTAAELYAQVIFVQRDTGKTIRNITVMGIGEPFDNYDNLMAFLALVHDPQALNISYRNVTISTCGLISEMLRFTDEGLPVNLALSLHAPQQQLRESIMPIARKYPLQELLACCRYYIKKTGRRISFEYTLFDGVNDSREQAVELANLLKGMLCHVNLITANKVPGSRFSGSSRKTVEAFKAVLVSEHIPCSVRRVLGRDIMAACGQLRRSIEE